MKRLILSLFLTFMCSLGFAQHRHMVRPFIDIARYEEVDSFPLERLMIHANKEIDSEGCIELGDGDYLVNVPYKDRMIIKYNSDRSKAIVLYNSYIFGRHFEFNIEDNERRTILWYEDKRIYCGYIYDKLFKVCKYVESRKEFKRFMKRFN